MSALHAPGFPEEAVRDRARRGARAVFPEEGSYGRTVIGARADTVSARDPLDLACLVPPVFMPRRLEKLIDLAHEPLHSDVDLSTRIGGFDTPCPLYVSAFGSTQVGADLALVIGAQAGALGIPMVVGENVVAGQGLRTGSSLFGRLASYTAALPEGLGGVVVQQSTEDADAEVWNRVYSDPSVTPLLESGRLGFELKVGQGAKPGLGGLTLVDAGEARRYAATHQVDQASGPGDDLWLRSSTPGTFTEEILDQQIRFMRNNFPRARVWVKLPPGRDVAEAARTAWGAGAHAVTVDGAEGGSGWAPSVFLDRVGLPLHECVRRIGSTHTDPSRPDTDRGTLLVSGRMWEAGRAVAAMALGADAVGLGRAALVAADEDPENGLTNLISAFRLEAALLISALGKYAVEDLEPEDVTLPPSQWPTPIAPDPRPVS